MPIRITIDTASELRKQFEAYDRDNYSIDGYKEILELFEDGATELDVIAICCDYEENDIDYIIEQYGIRESLDRENDEDVTEDEVLEFLNDRTYAVQLNNGSFFYHVF